MVEIPNSRPEREEINQEHALFSKLETLPKKNKIRSPEKPPAEYIFEKEINEKTAYQAVAFIKKVNREDKTREIIFHINSRGGDPVAAMRIIKEMRAVDNFITTRAGAEAMSAATLLLAAGDRREAHQNSDILIHQLSIACPYNKGDVVRVEEWQDFAKLVSKMNYAFFKEMEKMTGTKTHDYLHTTHNKDVHLTAMKARDYGIIDDILPAKKWDLPRNIPRRSPFGYWY